MRLGRRYLPKIQTVEEASLGNDMLTSLERCLDLPVGRIKVYVLVEQLEAVYQLMEIRAALGVQFVGFNTGHWDYVNSVADAVLAGGLGRGHSVNQRRETPLIVLLVWSDEERARDPRFDGYNALLLERTP